MRRKCSIELNLYEEDIEWMCEMASQRILPCSKSEVVSQAIHAFRAELSRRLAVGEGIANRS